MTRDRRRPLAALAFLGICTLAADGADRDRRQRRGRDVIYYDYLDGTQLQGGMIAVQPGNPLHHAVGIEPQAGTGQWGVETVLDNGPTANRINIVILGDGYTLEELDAYADHTAAVIAEFFGDEPFDAYMGYFNVFRVDVVSNESGVDHPDQGIFVDTALGMTYNCSNIRRLLCINVGAAIQAANDAPAWDQILALANSTRYGGAGYSSSNLGTLAGDNSAAVEIALHEFGHAFGDLADEYDYGGPVTYTGGERPEINATIHTADTLGASGLKWHLWLDEPMVDTFEGCHYSQFGIYRPTPDSKMRNLYRPFDAVNTEQLVIEMYRLVDPIDSVQPPLGAVAPDAVLTVIPLMPLDHDLDVQWSVDGQPIPGATEGTLDLAAQGLSGGAHTISVTVRDDTPRVRNENARAAWMTSTVAWTVEVPAGCVTTADCCDVDGNTVRDDACTWCACDAPTCNAVLLARYADMGGPFGACALDGFVNVHDRNHALTCFESTNACDSLNLDAGGAFGACPSDGFCNVHDVNHALAEFAGTQTCSCGAQPQVTAAPQAVGRVTVRLVPDLPTAHPGETIRISAVVDGAVAALQSMQLAATVSGGERGTLDLLELAAHTGPRSVWSGSPDFAAANRDTAMVLAGLNAAARAVPAGAVLAEFTYRASPDAAGDFVIDAPTPASGAGTVLIAGPEGYVELDIVPAVVRLGPAPKVAGRRAAR